MFYACSQRQQQQQEQVDWRTEGERGKRGRGTGSRANKVWMMRSSGVEKALGYSIFTIHSNTRSHYEIDQTNKILLWRESHYNAQRGVRGEGGFIGVVSLRRHLAKTIWGTHEVRWQHLDKAVTNGAEGGNWLDKLRMQAAITNSLRAGGRVCVCWVVYEMH